jgi:hypothetical protein
MAQYLLAVRYGYQPSGEEFRQLCVDVPAFDAKLEDVGVFVFHGGLHSPETTATVVRQSEMRTIDELLAESAAGEL